VLVASGHLGARLNGKAVALADLDQRKIGQADYRLQHPVLTPIQKIRIKKLFQDAGHPFTPENELQAAPGFVQLLHDLERRAGGDPPAPAQPHSPEVTALEGLSGNDLLFALFEKADPLQARISEWKKTAARIEQRLSAFQLAERMVHHGKELDGFEGHAATLEAIRNNRSLLHDPDPVAPALKEIGGALRAALTAAHTTYQQALSTERKRLDAHPAWSGLPEAKRAELLRAANVSELALPPLSTDRELAQALDAASFSAWHTQADALPTRFAQVLTAAIRESEPKAQRVSLPPATIKSEADLEKWLAQVRAAISEVLGKGPVIL